MIRAVDYAPLTAPVTREDVAAFRAASRNRPGFSRSPAVAVQVGVLIVVAVVFGGAVLLLLGTILSLLVSAPAQSDSPFAFGAVIFPLLILGVLALIAIFGIRAAVGGGSRWERWLRLDRFAAANGLVFAPVESNPAYPGAIFGIGSSRAATDHVRSASGRFLDYGNYRYVTGSGRSSTTHHWGFLALQLDRALPHMLLDARANNGMFGGSNLPAAFDRKQVLSLEGDFDEFFTLYCPQRYERDALYVFTPDLMALLIDSAAPFDVEIIDSWMFVYSAARFDLAQPAVHERLLRIVDTIGGKTLDRTDRYRDERVGDFAANTVAPEGRRLRRGVSVAAIIAVVVLVVFWVLPFFGSILNFFAP